MKSYLLFATFALVAAASSCRQSAAANNESQSPPTTISRGDTIAPDSIPLPAIADSIDYDTTQWQELTALDSTIRLDLRYATTNNFVGQILYDCARCFLRPAAAKAVVAAHQELRTEGLGLKLFDCYRPRSVQYKLWEIFPQPGYVADPRTGSIHNRGGAVDLTIVDSTGQELDMGTAFDFFGPAANHQYTKLPDTVLVNRRKLKALLQKHGFTAIRSEWWHYNFTARAYELADEMWPCPVE
ncbi:MAG: hypothetical protein DA408_13100 [Bacteroidetes bacterium]|nr:MAG: hypothetical protein C7N36_11375 [Bacteroidota bacterium]PTM11652.1 MAG: hypothetical protein DA408_13100 [Bacteroidota bacterium]